MVCDVKFYVAKFIKRKKKKFNIVLNENVGILKNVKVAQFLILG